MAVTVDFNQKNNAKPKRGAKGGPVVTGFDRYALTTARKQGQIALALWIGILALACLPWWFSEVMVPFRIGMPLWCLGSALAVLFVAPGAIAGKLRKAGKNSVIGGQNQPSLKAMIDKAAKIYGIAQPEAFIETPAAPVVKTPKAAPKKAPKPVAKPKVDAEEKGGLRSMIGGAAQAIRDRERPEKVEKIILDLGEPSVKATPGALILHKEAFENLDPPEISALVVSALVDIRQGHARRLFLLDVLPTMLPMMRLLVWPVVIYARLLEAMWLPHARQNTDRIALLLVKNPDLLVSAILKDHAARDAKMQEIGVSSEDVSNWINQRGHIGSSGKEISTQYKLGRAIHEDPPLESRLQRLQNWGKSPEFKAALEELKTRR